jgi:NAD(P)-dependent dehydrogenase (short-subunit alcohol dehydrogenase family)
MATYLIAGGSSGIGHALAELLASQGHRVFATYNTHQKENDGPVTYLHWSALAEGQEELALPDSLDGLVYCPGSINLKPFARIKPEDFLQDFNLQVAGAVKLIQQCLPSLRKSTQSSIILFSTVAVQKGLPFHSQVSASKGAIEGLTRALAAEFAPSIRVNCIAPSLTDTPLAAGLLNTDQKKEANAQRHPLKRVGEPRDLAEMAAFLLSPKSSWITGQVIGVDGGMGSLGS